MHFPQNIFAWVLLKLQKASCFLPFLSLSFSFPSVPTFLALFFVFGFLTRLVKDSSYLLF